MSIVHVGASSGRAKTSRSLQRQSISPPLWANSWKLNRLACSLNQRRVANQLAGLLLAGSLAGSLVACGADTSESQSTTEPTTCSYPAAPYGVSVGDVLGSQLAWQGFAARSNVAGIVAIGDFHDCDGMDNTNAVLFVTVTAGCSECVLHLEKLEARMVSWEPNGIHVVVLVANSAQGVSTVADAETWKSIASLDALAVVADPNASFVLGSDVGYPNLVVVDPRTMTVIERQLGFDDEQSTLEELAAENAATG